MNTSFIKKLSSRLDFFIFGIILIGIFLRFYHIDRAVGGGDENQILLEWVYYPIEHIIGTFTHGTGGHHILHTICLRLMILLFGDDNSIAIRFPAFIAGICYLWMIYKTTLLFSGSKPTARLALLAATLNPIHIYYSQTARGYSFLMLFAILVLYSALKLYHKYDKVKWGSAFVVSMVLLIYTLPVSVLYYIAFAGWVGWVSIHQHANKSNSHPSPYQPYSGKVWASLLILISLFTLLLYSPVIKQMLFASQDYYSTTIPYANRLEIFTLFFPKLINKVFEGNLLIFAPFIILGIFFGKVTTNKLRSLPIFLLLVPFIISIATGIAWYPRTYLFVHPILIICFATGSIWSFEKIKAVKNEISIHQSASVGFIILFSGISLNYIFTTLFNKFTTYSGVEYASSVKKSSLSKDLILISDPKNYLHARSIYKNNLARIISQNEMDGVKIIAPNDFKIDKYFVNSNLGWVPIFGKITTHNTKSKSKLVLNKYIYQITKPNSDTLFSVDFDQMNNWETISGIGDFKNDSTRKLEGQHSLSIKANYQNNLVLRSRPSKNIKIKKPSLIILVWSATKFNNNHILYDPILTVRSKNFQQNKVLQMTMGKMNWGINLRLRENSKSLVSYEWPTFVSIGLLPAGSHSLNLILKVDKGHDVLFDNFRVFTSEVLDS